MFYSKCISTDPVYLKNHQIYLELCYNCDSQNPGYLTGYLNKQAV